MANLEKRHVASPELVDDLINFLQISNPDSVDPVKVRKCLKEQLAQMKRAFLAYCEETEYNRSVEFEKKVSFLEDLSFQVLYHEIEDKPEGMSNKDFLLDVKFEEYSTAAVEKVISQWYKW